MGDFRAIWTYLVFALTEVAVTHLGMFGDYCVRTELLCSIVVVKTTCRLAPLTTLAHAICFAVRMEPKHMRAVFMLLNGGTKLCLCILHAQCRHLLQAPLCRCHADSLTRRS